ncbi:MAG: Cytochrome c oxidase caa3-type assembly factor CtaG_BS (unrelated to Cox11-CtaG family) [uncultured Nocardioidaceae bacterium]|uniref:Cytochrome c oxidase caa3-type assembly factor CtaG_BS (Unrelated to Cox11-CtaG family) n=1 Tax=uncultured Nocardioidaceae bacterium TaxID=253824 RepID=A0A6J4N7R4_9ACTN|nr:MAG: Cytochrome c oxidase caa3-type assembly factor CtaG_BS (unrelated to Cox11-CtaG family) [uncultured Nocardioidaceae bacterium]
MLARVDVEELSQLPPFEVSRILTEWGIDPFLNVLTVWVAGAYLYGVWVLRSRGDSWSLARTFSFVVVGMGSFYVVTSSGIAAYDSALLSVHMVQHMALSMLVPLALALGAPVTLALRVLPRRPRRWLLAVLHSRLVTVLSFPPLAFALFVLSPWLLYFSSWYDATLTSAFVHEMMHVHLVLVGSLFLWPLVGVDPVPGRVSYPFRMMLMVLTLPFHAFLGVTIMGQEELIGGDWYTSLPMDWLPSPVDDQHLAGGILWGTGDVVGIVFFLVLFAQWVRSSMREAEREDRRLDRLERMEQGRAE